MNNREAAVHLLKAAKLILAGPWLSPERLKPEKAIRQRERALLRENLPLPERAALFNLIDTVAMRGHDPGDLTRRPEFRGWGREDFIRLNQRLKQRYALATMS